MAEDVKPGELTSEFKVAKSSGTWGIVAMVLGFLATIGGTIAVSLGADTELGIVAGAVVAFAGIAQKTLTDLGYINSRTQVKASAANTK